MKFNLQKYFAFLLLLIFSSCGIWTDFTTYFNRYYNAKKLFEEAETELENRETKQSLFEFREEQPPPKARQNLDQVIEKCSKILQFSEESSYFDEALFMIGKSYYIQGNYTKALRKFNELASLEETELKQENKLWIAKSMLQLRQFDEGLQLLEEVKKEALEEENEETLYDAYLTEARYLVYREDLTTAIAAANKLFDVAEDDQVKAKIAYELGKLYLLNEDYENAAASFSNVSEYEPTFDVEFQSLLEYAKVLRQLDRTEESLEVLEDLKVEDKFQDKRDQIELEIAEAKYSEGNIKEALKDFVNIDSSYTRTESAGIAAFRRAEILEKDFFDFDSAKFLYDRVNRTSAPQEYKDNAREKSFLLKKYRDFNDNLFKYERQLVYLVDTSKYYTDSAAYFGYYARKDSIDALIKEMKELQGQNFDSSKYVMNENPPFRAQPVIPNVSVDSMRTKIAQTKYELGNLYFTDLDVPDSAYYQYLDILTNYEGTPYQAKTMYALGSYYLTINRKEKADSLFREVYNNYETDPIVNAAAERLGEELVLQSDDPAEPVYRAAEDSMYAEKYNQAIAKLFNITEQYPESQFAPKSLYTIGFILENELDMPDSAASIYDSLTSNYGRTEYASAVQKRLRFYKSYQKSIQDSIKKAEEALRLKDSLRADSIAAAKAVMDTPQISDSLQIPDSVRTDSLKTGNVTEPADTSKITLPARTDSTKTGKRDEREQQRSKALEPKIEPPVSKAVEFKKALEKDTTTTEPDTTKKKTEAPPDTTKRNN